MTSVSAVLRRGDKDSPPESLLRHHTAASPEGHRGGVQNDRAGRPSGFMRSAYVASRSDCSRYPGAAVPDLWIGNPTRPRKPLTDAAFGGAVSDLCLSPGRARGRGIRLIARKSISESRAYLEAPEFPLIPLRAVYA